MVRFDAYTATTAAANPYQLADLLGPGLTHREGRGFHGFGHRVGFVDETTATEVGSVSWGGQHGELAMVEVKGERSPDVVERLRSVFPHRVTRMDTCADFDAPRAFSRVMRACQAVKRGHRIWGEKRGDWEDHPEKGRTYYLGANTSPVRMRAYEKGKQPEYAHLSKPDWVRAEVQIRPKGDARHTFATISALDAWGAARWTRDLAGQLLKQHVDPHPAGTVYRQSDLERRLDWLCAQGGPTLLELRDALGSWECVGLTLGEKIKAKMEKQHGR